MAMSHSVPMESTDATNFVSDPRLRTFTCAHARAPPVMQRLHRSHDRMASAPTCLLPTT